MNNETSTAEKTSESVTIKNNFSKTPMMVLAEMMNKQGKQPIYEMVEEPKLFRYRVSCDSFSAEGEGKTKQEARQAAARAFLCQSIEDNKLSTVNRPEKNDLIANGNYVGCLQNICMRHKIPLPGYALDKVSGPCHAKEFTISCTVIKSVSFGRGRTKKIAKQEAAQVMWKAIIEEINCEASIDSSETSD